MRKPKAASASATATPYAAPPELAGLSAVVINLRSRPDRWKRISRAFAKRLSWLPFERLEAVDGKVHPPADSDVTRRWSTADIAAFCDWYYVKRLTMSPGERGCWDGVAPPRAAGAGRGCLRRFVVAVFHPGPQPYQKPR